MTASEVDCRSECDSNLELDDSFITNVNDEVLNNKVPSSSSSEENEDGEIIFEERGLGAFDDFLNRRP